MTISAVDVLQNYGVTFRGLYPTIIHAEVSWDPAQVNSNSFISESFTLPGTKFGDQVLASVDVDLQNLVLFGHINAADSVDLHLINNTAGAVDIGACTCHVVVLQHVKP